MDLWDVLVIVGCIVIAVGLWWIYEPSSLLFAGTVLVVGGIVGARAGIRTGREKE